MKTNKKNSNKKKKYFTFVSLKGNLTKKNIKLI